MLGRDACRVRVRPDDAAGGIREQSAATLLAASTVYRCRPPDLSFRHSQVEHELDLLWDA